MATVTPNRSIVSSGSTYYEKLSIESNKNFQILLGLLSSYWSSSIDGPLYTRCLKTMAIELSKIKLMLDDVFLDNSYTNLRTDYLYQTLTSMVFTDGNRDFRVDDVDFQQFMVDLIPKFFEGSTPKGILDAIKLIYPTVVKIFENMEHDRATDLQFEFDISIFLNDPRILALVKTDGNLRFILDLIKPAHTVYQLKNILQDQISTSGVGDVNSNKMNIYFQEDFRSDWLGIKDVDPFGRLIPISVVNEVVVL